MKLFKRLTFIIAIGLLFGCGQNGDAKKIKAIDTIKPTKPEALIVNEVSGDSIKLSWGASTDNWGIKGYRIYRKGIVVATVNDLSYTDQGLSSNTNYCYQVAAVDKGDNESDKTDEICASTGTNTKASTSKLFGSPGAVLQILKSVSDTKNNIYLKGDFTGTVDFDPGPGEDIKTSPMDNASFITKFNSDGTYAWTRIFGSLLTATHVAHNENEITICSNGTVYTCCTFQNTADFNPEGGHDIKTSSGSMDIAITKVNPDGTYAWTKVIGGSGMEGYPLCHVDKSDNLYISGEIGSAYSYSIDFDITGGSDIISVPGNGDFKVFVTRINSDGSYAWTKLIGGSNYSACIIDPSALKTDSKGNVYLAGMFMSLNGADFDPGPGQDIKITQYGNNYSNFVTKINADSSYGWTKTIDTHTNSMDNLLTIDGDSNIYISGFFNGTTDFDPGVGTDIRDSEGGANPFLSRLNSDGTYAWTRTIPLTMDYESGSTGNTPMLNGIYVLNNRLFFTGSFDGSANFQEGGSDILDATQYDRGLFTTKINIDGSYDSTKVLPDHLGSQLFFTNSGTAFLSGSFNGSLDLDPTTDEENSTSVGDIDGFLFQIKDSFFK